MTVNDRLVNKNISQKDLGYLAGIIDTMGSFCVCSYESKGIHGWHCNIFILSTNRALLDWINNTLFCDSSSIDVIPARGMYKKTVNRIVIAGKVMDHVLPLIRDMLLFKQQHVDLVLRFRKTVNLHLVRRGRPLPDHLAQERSYVAKALKSINQKTRESKKEDKKDVKKHDGPKPWPGPRASAGPAT